MRGQREGGTSAGRRGRPLELTLQHHDLLLCDGEAGTDVVDATGIALVACEERLPAFEHVVGDTADARGQAPDDAIEPGDFFLGVFGHAAAEPGEFIVLGVDVRRHLLQIHDEPRLKVHELFGLLPQ